MDKRKELKKLGLLDRIKLNLMCKWLEDYGFDDILNEHPEVQKEFGIKLGEYLDQFHNKP